MVNTKQTVVEYPGLEGFKVTFSAMSKQVSTKIHSECKENVFDKVSKQHVDRINEDKFVKAFAKEAIKGWTGLKWEYLQEFLLVDMSLIEDPEAEMPYTEEDAIELLKGSNVFEAWVNEVVFDLNSFRD